MSALATTRAGVRKLLEVWATSAETAALVPCSKRNAHEMLKSRPRRKRQEKSKNGKQPYEYLLPTDLAFKKVNAEFALAARPSEGPAPQHRLVSELPEDDRQKFEERRAAAELMAQLEQDGLSRAKVAAEAARRTGKSESFFLDWSRAISKDGLAAAIPPARRKDFRQFRRLAPKVQDFLVCKYTDEGIGNVSLIHEALIREWASLGVAGDPPSRGTVNTFCNGDETRGIPSAIPAQAKTLALKGPRAWWSKHSPHLQREAPRPMEWWVLDHRILDVDCRNMLFAELEPQKLFRLHLTAVMDWGSLAWMGFCLAPQASSRTIGSALRLAFADYGLPQNLYWDNGEDFKKVQRALQGEEFGERVQSFLRQSGVEEFGITRALPFHPRSKPIEGRFAALSQRFDLMWGAAYQGNSPMRRSEYNEAAQKRHRKWLDGTAASTVLPSDCEVIAAAVQWMIEDNNRARRALDGKSPFQALEEFAPPKQRRHADRRLLDILLCERDRRKVQRGGCVQLDNRRYEPADETALLPMNVREGQEIVVLRDPYCLEEAAALDPETMEFVAELRLQDFVAQSPNGHITRDQIQAGMRRERGLKRAWMGYLAFYAALGRAQGWKSERELLVARATGTDGRGVPPGAAPGAGEPRKMTVQASRLELGPAFASDAVSGMPDISKLEMEE